MFYKLSCPVVKLQVTMSKPWINQTSKACNALVTQVTQIWFIEVKLTTLFKRTLLSGPREILNVPAISRVQGSSGNLQNNHSDLKHKQKTNIFHSSLSHQNYLLAWIRCKLIVFSSSLRNLTSAPYLPTVPSSTRMKCEWRLFRTFSLLNGFNRVWYGATT